MEDVMASLQRAGLEVLPTVVQRDGWWHYKCPVGIPSRDKPLLKNYITGYCKAAKWQARVKFHRAATLSISLEKA